MFKFILTQTLCQIYKCTQTAESDWKKGQTVITHVHSHTPRGLPMPFLLLLNLHVLFSVLIETTSFLVRKYNLWKRTSIHLITTFSPTCISAFILWFCSCFTDEFFVFLTKTKLFTHAPYFFLHHILQSIMAAFPSCCCII